MMVLCSPLSLPSPVDVAAELRLDAMLNEELGSPESLFELQPVSGFSKRLSLAEALEAPSENLVMADWRPLILQLAKFQPTLSIAEVDNLKTKVASIADREGGREMLKLFNSVYAP